MGKRPKGFTLIEVLVVIAVIAVLIALLLPGSVDVNNGLILALAAGAGDVWLSF